MNNGETFRDGFRLNHWIFIKLAIFLYPRGYSSLSTEAKEQSIDLHPTQVGGLQTKEQGAWLWVCPREHQAVAPHAISTISMKLFQYKGSTQKHWRTNLSLFFRGGDRPPPRFFLVFTREIASKSEKCMKLSLRWYLTDYTDGLHTYYYILSNSNNTEANKWLCFKTFRCIQIFDDFWGQISPLVRKLQHILIPPW